MSLIPQNKNNPCYGCVAPKRHVGCHATCKDYIDSVDLYHKKQEKIRKKKDEDKAYTDYCVKAYERITK